MRVCHWTNTGYVTYDSKAPSAVTFGSRVLDGGFISFESSYLQSNSSSEGYPASAGIITASLLSDFSVKLHAFHLKVIRKPSFEEGSLSKQLSRAPWRICDKIPLPYRRSHKSPHLRLPGSDINFRYSNIESSLEKARVLFLIIHLNMKTNRYRELLLPANRPRDLFQIQSIMVCPFSIDTDRPY